WSPISALHRDSDERSSGSVPKWRAILEEFGMPALAVGFFVAMLWRSIPAHELVGLSFLLMLVFFVTGRSVLGNIFQLFSMARQNRGLRKKIRDLNQRLQKLLKAYDELEAKIQRRNEQLTTLREKYIRETRNHQIAVDKIRHMCETRIKTYESERQRARTFLADPENKQTYAEFAEQR
ncbi:MAG: hypothetical protein NZ534_13190, partial [Bacteroidia bacterium]|nr:hypothetical protein [Bacteroidia bacterium]